MERTYANQIRACALERDITAYYLLYITACNHFFYDLARYQCRPPVLFKFTERPRNSFCRFGRYLLYNIRRKTPKYFFSAFFIFNLLFYLCFDLLFCGPQDAALRSRTMRSAPRRTRCPPARELSCRQSFRLSVFQVHPRAPIISKALSKHLRRNLYL